MTNKTIPRTLILMSVLLLTFHCATAAGRIIYVDANVPAGGDGASWATAFKYLQDALADANSDPHPDDIWVAQGVYEPDQDVGGNVAPGDRYATFQLISGVGLYGGFASGGDPNWYDRDPNMHETMLSGDLDGNDVDVTDPRDLLTEPTRGENSYHVVTGGGTDANAMLDGVTITGGNANGPGGLEYYSFGGGMWNYGGSPTVTNCTFGGNSASGGGGGMANDGYGNPTVTNCTFSGNWAAFGGGMSNMVSSPTVTGCMFTANAAGAYGAGMNNLNSSATVTNCIFSHNAAEYGGGMCLTLLDGRPTVTNCTFSHNSAGYGGGMYSEMNNSPDVADSPKVTNCILWSNNATLGGNEIAIYFMGTIDVKYCDVEGGAANIHNDGGLLHWGTGNVSTDPLFADPPNDDYHLKSEGGRWDPCSQNWVLDGVTSPCIDTGDPCTSFAAELSPHGCRANMGAFGNTEQASKSPVMASLCCESYECAGQRFGDATCDGNVNLADLFALKGHFGTSAPWADDQCCADFSHDGNVNVDDLYSLKAGFGLGPYSPSTGNQNCPP
ncbi:MAG: right-handed parallel beta-helix repeat-containing protein [Planctomycetota bacterium]